MTPDEIVTSILIKYSNPERDETHCCMSELKCDLVRVMEGFVRERDSVQEMHDAFLRLLGD